MSTKKFIITIDTEGDSQWDPNAPCSTRNARYIPRFQELAEKYGFQPTWLTNYEMAEDPFYVEYMTQKLKEGQCEIGMHLHAWNNPPEYSLKKVTNQRDYLIEYPEHIMDEKIKVITAKLEDSFSTKMLSHRSGRWVTNETYFRLLDKYGYRFDCSVTPYVNWIPCLGTTGMPGTDYRHYPAQPYTIYGNVLEVPMSIRPMKFFSLNNVHSLWDFLYETKCSIKNRDLWLRPTRDISFTRLKRVLDVVEEDSDYAMFMMHSSEMMPGGSPSFPDEKSIEALYRCLDKLFAEASQRGYTGCKLSDYQRQE